MTIGQYPAIPIADQFEGEGDRKKLKTKGARTYHSKNQSPGGGWTFSGGPAASRPRGAGGEDEATLISSKLRFIA